MNHRYLLEVNGKSRWVEGQWLQGELWLHLDGETFIVESETKSFGQGKAGAAKSDIVAPMPGKVTKVFAQDGSSVAAGQVLVVMEAMKMEYSLKAELAGTVAKVDCAVGDQVSLGKTLVKIKPGTAE